MGYNRLCSTIRKYMPSEECVNRSLRWLAGWCQQRRAWTTGIVWTERRRWWRCIHLRTIVGWDSGSHSFPTAGTS